jgi:hypothetical protein
VTHVTDNSKAQHLGCRENNTLTIKQLDQGHLVTHTCNLKGMDSIIAIVFEPSDTCPAAWGPSIMIKLAPATQPHAPAKKFCHSQGGAKQKGSQRGTHPIFLCHLCPHVPAARSQALKPRLTLSRSATRPECGYIRGDPRRPEWSDAHCGCQVAGVTRSAASSAAESPQIGRSECALRLAA